MEALSQNYSISYENDIQHSYLVIEASSEEEIIDYQLRIMQENPTAQLLSLHKKQIDHRVYLFYDITSKITFAQLLKRKSFTKHELLSVLKSILSALKLGSAYLLQDGSFILGNEFIYIDPATFAVSIAYMPIKANQDLTKAFSNWLMDLLIYKVSFAPSSEADFVYPLLSFLKDEDFNFSQLDNMLDKLALQQNALVRDSEVKKPDLKHEVSGNKRLSSKYIQKRKNNLLLLILQVFFIALAGFLIKYFFSGGEDMDISKLSGIFIVIAGTDFLIVKKLKENSNKDELVYSNKAIETDKLSDLAREKRLKVNGLHRNAKIETAAALDANRYLNPKDLETKVLMQVEKSCPYFMGTVEGQKEKIYIDKPSFLFGRLKHQSDYVAANRAVGKLHAEIIIRGSSCYLKDLNSRNGTYINGERIASNVEYSLQNNDSVTFANSEYKFIWS